VPRLRTADQKRTRLKISEQCLERLNKNRKAITAAEGYFADLTKNHSRDGIMALEHSWNKYISPNGDYIKK
jgi:hypothetical protein